MELNELPRNVKVKNNKTQIFKKDRETERQRDRETERQRDRETERQTDRQAVSYMFYYSLRLASYNIQHLPLIFNEEKHHQM